MEVAFGSLGREADGGGDPDLDVRVREWDAAGGGAGVLRDEPGWAVLQGVGKLSAKTGVPVNSLWVQWAWTCLLCLSGSYGQLLDYVIFAVLIFYILTIVGLFVLRRTRPDAPRPYKAIGYPVLPALYIVMAAWISVVLLRYKPQYTWPGLMLVLLGVPVYLVWTQKGSCKLLSMTL